MKVRPAIHRAPIAKALPLLLCLFATTPGHPEGLTYTLAAELKSPNEELSGFFGRAVSGVPDANGDGFGDVFVGARNEDPGGVNSAGRVYLFDGRSGELLRTLTSPNLQEGGEFGNVVYGLHDINGNGSGDIFIGTAVEVVESASGPRSITYILDGATGNIIHFLLNPTPTSGSFGASITEMPDTNGNGAVDLAVGSFSSAGDVDIFDSFTGLHLRTIPAPVPGGGFGSSVAAIEDLNGNGFADLIVGAPRFPSDFTPRGRVYIVDGKSGDLIHTLESPRAGESARFGAAVKSVPDIDGDGVEDIVVGAWGEISVYLFSGSTGDFLRTIRSPTNDSLGAFGASLDTGQWPSKVPLSMILIGAEGERAKATGLDSAGRAFLFNSETLDLIQTFTSPNREINGDFAQSVSFIPDSNGDFVPDIVIGTEGESPGDSPSNAGRAYIFHSRNPECFLDDDRSDINLDGKVNALDLEILLEDWGKVTGAG